MWLWATVGAVLPGNFKIKKSKIRGQQSFGMLCSQKELGLGEDSQGIMILTEGDPRPGQNFSEAYPTDVVFEINVTPNRADCLSHIGLARELCTLLDRPVRMPDWKLEEGGKGIDQWIHVEVKDAKACPRYCGRVISGVKVGPSPAWLKKALTSIGLNSMNNVVDVTNFVLFEYGQPLHAFDYRKIKNSKIIVEKAKSGETFTSLDGTEVELDHQDLVIRDGLRPVALAGVVGGKSSAVSESTSDIFLESAFFQSQTVRRNSRNHGIETDSSYRFSRGVDPKQTHNAMDRAVTLIQEVAGGELQKGAIDIYPEVMNPPEIPITIDSISERLGYGVEKGDFENWMKRLGCELTESDGGFRVKPPTWRWDLEIKEDLIEEYARLHGYDAIPETLPPLVGEPGDHDPLFDFNQKITSLLAGFGLNQCVNYAFIPKGQSQRIWTSSDLSTFHGLKMSDTPIELINPISEELSVMRESLLPSLLKNLVFNYNRGNSVGRIFEVAPVHYKKDEDFCEQNRLAIAFWGQTEGLWNSKKENQVVYELKSTVESLLKSLGCGGFRFEPVTSDQCPGGFHPGQNLTLFYGGQNLGVLGSMHPELVDENKIRCEVAWAEFCLEGLMKGLSHSSKFKAFPRYPAVERDVAFLADEKLTSGQISSEIKKAAGDLLIQHGVFDVYQDEELKNAGLKSIAFRLRFQSEKQTLDDREVNRLRDHIVSSVCQKLGLEIR